MISNCRPNTAYDVDLSNVGGCAIPTPVRGLPEIYAQLGHRFLQAWSRVHAL
jgi:hypothetical protein